MNNLTLEERVAIVRRSLTIQMKTKLKNLLKHLSDHEVERHADDFARNAMQALVMAEEIPREV
jgi:hypothetical protein